MIYLSNCFIILGKTQGLFFLTKRKQMDLQSYDHYIVAFSGGKDSIACVLHLLDEGVNRSKIELWHHLVDGENDIFMDWPCTKAYCQQFAKEFKLPIFFSYKKGGFRAEMLRNNSPTMPNCFSVPVKPNPYYNYIHGDSFSDPMVECGLEEATGFRLTSSGGNGPLNTRMKFPQISPDLRVRWCSSYLKIDVCTAAIVNQKRFEKSKTLLTSGERAEESPARAKYKVFEIDRSDNRYGKKQRHVDRWRPVHGWDINKVWDKIREYKVDPHPAYKLGFGRLSCMFCIFGNPAQWASAKLLDQERFYEIANYETEFGLTIKRNANIEEHASYGVPYKMDEKLMKVAMDFNAHFNIFVDQWEAPLGMNSEQIGPT